MMRSGHGIINVICILWKASDCSLLEGDPRLLS